MYQHSFSIPDCVLRRRRAGERKNTAVQSERIYSRLCAMSTCTPRGYSIAYCTKSNQTRLGEYHFVVVVVMGFLFKLPSPTSLEAGKAALVWCVRRLEIISDKLHLYSMEAANTSSSRFTVWTLRISSSCRSLWL